MRIVLGVGGGIAAYKACELTSRLVKAQHEVLVLMTEAAVRFVAPLTFSALSGRQVAISSVDEPMGPLSHVKLAKWADLLVIAPATQDLMARLALGLADDMLTLTYAGFRGPVLMAPAMEPEMWEHPRTQGHMHTLIQGGASIVGPETGRMASGDHGVGRMAEPVTIFREIERASTPKDLAGQKILITAGATWEFFDPVRMLTNPSTGLMGVMMAKEAANRGAEVTLVHGPRCSLEPIGKGVVTIEATSARDMQRAVNRLVGKQDIVIGAAAVSDFRPSKLLTHKAHKDDVGLTWEMAPNPDILAEVGAQYSGQKILIGFAAETDHVVESAREKLRRKHLDAVVANTVGSDQGFGSGRHESWLVTAKDQWILSGEAKEETARRLLDYVRDLVASRQGRIEES